MRWVLLAAIVLAPFGAWQLLERGVVWFQSPPLDRYPVRGIDVSHHNAPIDWGALASEELAFVYVKATEGGDFVDPRFAEHWVGAARGAERRGAYHFFTFCRSGAEQAANFAATVPVDPDALPPVIDVEFGGNCAARPPWPEVERELGVVVDAMAARYGQTPILYVTEELLAQYPVDHLGPPLWIRSIYGAPDRPFALWQYHCRARVAGIDGPVDLNVASNTWWTETTPR